MTANSQQINALRGLGCMLLVTYHVVGADSTAGLRIHDGFFRDASDLLRYVRMPLFTFLSGLVYALRPYSGDWRGFLSGKVRRLLIPLVVVGTLFHFVRSATEGTHVDSAPLLVSLIWPSSHLWYLNALFLVFVATMLLEAAKVLARPPGFLIVFVTAAFICSLEGQFSFFAFDRALYLFPFFMAGIAMQRFGIRAALHWKLGLLATLAVLAVLVGMAMGTVPNFSRSSLSGLGLGLMSCLALLSLNLAPSGLARLGTYSYTIFLYHIFFTAGTRIALRKVGIADTETLFVCASGAGLIGPILIDRIFSGTRMTQQLFLGRSSSATSKFWLSDRISRCSSSAS